MTWRVLFNTADNTYRLRGLDGGVIFALSYGVGDDDNDTIERGIRSGFLVVTTIFPTLESRQSAQRALVLNNGGYPTQSGTPSADQALIDRIEALEMLGGGGGSGSYRHVQTLAATVWDVTHSLGYDPAGIRLIDHLGIERDEFAVQYMSAGSTLRLTHDLPLRGFAVLS